MTQVSNKADPVGTGDVISWTPSGRYRKCELRVGLAGPSAG